MRWPLRAPPLLPDAPGMFGAVRKHDVHTGIDLYCDLGTEVVAMEAGEVISIEKFTGPHAEDPSPWWNDTDAILVRGASGVIVYGEVAPLVKVGDRVREGQTLATIQQSVLKTDRGRPMTMLHLEWMSRSARATTWWRLGDPRPACLRDPLTLLLIAEAEPIPRYCAQTEQ